MALAAESGPLVAQLLAGPLARAAPRPRSRTAERQAKSDDLFGQSSGSSARVQEWVSFWDALEASVDELLRPNRGLFDKVALPAIRSEAIKAHVLSGECALAAGKLNLSLARLNGYLEQAGPFLAGQEPTLADVCGVALLLGLFQDALPATLRRRHTSVLTWLESCLDLPGFELFGGSEGVEFCTWSDEEELALEKLMSSAQIKLEGCLWSPPDIPDPVNAVPAPSDGPQEQGSASEVSSPNVLVPTASATVSASTALAEQLQGSVHDVARSIEDSSPSSETTRASPAAGGLRSRLACYLRSFMTTAACTLDADWSVFLGADELHRGYMRERAARTRAKAKNDPWALADDPWQSAARKLKKGAACSSASPPSSAFAAGSGGGNLGWAMDGSWDTSPVPARPSSWGADGSDLCFDLHAPLLPLPAVRGAASDQWWDPELLAESQQYAAVSKPSSLALPLVARARWEAASWNFAHVAHRRLQALDATTGRESASGDAQGAWKGRRGFCSCIDTNSSGVQVIAKNEDAFAHFERLAAEGAVCFQFVALVQGHVAATPQAPREGVIDVPLRRWHASGSWRDSGSVACCEGSPAATKYTVLRQLTVPARSGGPLQCWGRERCFSLLHVRTLTSHLQQVRAHLAFMGHPIVCDSRYATASYEDDCVISPRLFLHTTRVSFDTADGSAFVAECDLSADLLAAFSRLQAFAEPPTCAADGAAEPDPEATAKAKASGARRSGLAAVLAVSPGVRRGGNGASTDAVSPAPDGELSSPSSAPAAQEAVPDDGGERRLVQRCVVSGRLHTCSRRVVHQGDRAAYLWRLSPGSFDDHSSATAAGAATGALEKAPAWGASSLWLPPSLRERRGCEEATQEESPPARSPSPAPRSPAADAEAAGFEAAKASRLSPSVWALGAARAGGAASPEIGEPQTVGVPAG
eukprot:TRINITY_DN46786_c0_g1_i1.p1 TRINITY_DN46786_c0_g1~~TRINITY_DN46786_c0_g1_i1.p1  ORF type:complete len:941 (-),score=200.28 TRINITY_DN46786_c0_g1_i1:72-2858(-)